MSDAKKLRPIQLKTEYGRPVFNIHSEKFPRIIPLVEGIAALEISFKIFRLTRRFHQKFPPSEMKGFIDGSKTPALDPSIWQLCLSNINDFSRKFHHTWNETAQEIWKWPEMKIPDLDFDPNTVYKIYLDCVNKERAKVIEINKARAIEKARATNRSRDHEKTIAEQRVKDEKRAREAEIEPVNIDENLWEFKGFVYEVSGFHNDEEAKLLILEEFDKERQLFERLRLKFDRTPHSEPSASRPRIPESVRIEVWRRDGGKCARCGSRTNLEYDHIVPISKGGSNTARNIELLCEKCNRSKSNNVT